MILYHGGYRAIEAPHIITGGFAKDFGDGFYCTELKEQAIRWSRRYTTPIVTLFDYKDNATLKQLHFPTMSEVWLDFIVNCRNHIPHDYDIVSGPMADDQIYNYISDYINGILTREQFWVLAKFKYPTHQINFCTSNALNCLTYIGSEAIHL